MSEQVRIGVIGCGAGRFHASRYASLENVELVALAGLEQDRCRVVADQYNIPHVYRDYTELIVRPDIDGVSICVPNSLHAPMAIAALEAGKHVLVEKPLATSVAEGEAMRAAAARAGRVLMVVFNYRFRNDSQILKRYIEAGNLGEVYFAQAGWLRDQGIPLGASGWFTDKSRAGGGCLIDLGVHMLDLTLWLMGNPRVLSVSASTYAALGPRGRGLFPGRRFQGEADLDRASVVDFDVEDLVTAFLRLETGATLVLEISWAGYTQRGDRFFVHLWGDEGGAEMNVLNYVHEDTLRFYTDVEGARTEIRPQVTGDGDVSVNSEFVRAIRQGVAVSPTVEEGLRVLRVIEAIYRSAAEGREVTIEPDSR
jgi:predicted dehydrogenase